MSLPCAETDGHGTSRSTRSYCRPGRGSLDFKLSQLHKSNYFHVAGTCSHGNKHPRPAGCARHRRSRRARESRFQHRRYARPQGLRHRPSASGKPVALAAEVNANMPYMPGEAEVERGEFDVMLEPEGAASISLRHPRSPSPSPTMLWRCAPPPRQGWRHAADRDRLVSDAWRTR